MTTIKARILVFGMGIEIFEQSEIEIEIRENSTVGDLKQKMEEDFPRLKSLGSYILAVNQAMVPNEWLLKTEDEIAFIPPVSGG